MSTSKKNNHESKYSTYTSCKTKLVGFLGCSYSALDPLYRVACFADVYRHLVASISVEIQRRVARQVMSFWPGDGGWWLNVG